MKVDLPTPGAPLMPTRNESPLLGSSASSSAPASRRCPGSVDSTSVIAFASALRSRASTPRTSAACSPACGAAGGSLGMLNALRGADALAAARRADLAQHLLRAIGDRRAGTEYAADAGLLEERVVLRRDDAADEHHDFAGALLAQLGDQRGHERLVAGRERRDADGVHVVLDRLARAFLRCLEERADVDIESQVRKRGRDHFRAAIMAVLPELGDENARTAALFAREALDLALQFVPSVVFLERGAIDSGDALRVRPVAAPDLLHCHAHLPDGRARADGPDREIEQVPGTGCRSGGDRTQ